MDTVIAEVYELLKEIEEKFEQLRSAINRTLARVPFWLDWIVDEVQRGWDEVCQKMSEFWALIQEFLAKAGDMGALERAALSWHTDVGGPASAQSQVADLGELLVDDHWSGAAADRYRDKVPGQQRAMEAIRNEFSNVVSGALDDMRSGISDFWWGIVGTLAGLVIAIAGGLTATGTIIGLPAVPVMIVLGAGVAIVSFLAGKAALESAATSANNTLTQAASYGQTSWPAFALP